MNHARDAVLFTDGSRDVRADVAEPSGQERRARRPVSRHPVPLIEAPCPNSAPEELPQALRQVQLGRSRRIGAEAEG